MGNCEGFVVLTFLTHTVRPKAVDQMRPVGVAFFELVPGVFELFLPGLVLK